MFSQMEGMVLLAYVAYIDEIMCIYSCYQVVV